MAQQSLAATPSSRQDIVSALLSDYYGNSFGDEKSPSVYSPEPPTSQLPPLPPRKDSLVARKPVPAAQRMDAKFQLRGKQSHLFFLVFGTMGSNLAVDLESV